MMKTKKYFERLLAGVCVLGLVISCNSCGGGSSTSPATPANVDGIWLFTGQLSTNSCDLDAAQALSGSIRFSQSGATVTTPRVDFQSGPYFTYRGIVTGNSVSMAAVDPYVMQNGGTVIHFGSGVEIPSIRNDSSGDGSINLTGACIQGCSGSCQTIWSGTWTKQ